MKYTVLTSFSGLVRGTKGGVVDITDPGIADDLLRAGYIEKIAEVEPSVIEEAQEAKEVVPEKTKKPATKKTKKLEV